MHGWANNPNVDSRDRLIAGVCALLAHAFLAALLFRQASAGRGNHQNGQDNGDSLTVYPAMLAPTANKTQPATAASNSTITNALKAQPNSQAKEQVLPTSNPNALQPVSQAGLNTGISALERNTTQHPALQTIASSATSASSGSNGEHNLLAIYQAAMRAAIFKTWQGISVHNYPVGCTIHISQSPGGTVTATSAAACGLSREDQLQLEASALMAQPMPYAGYESVFSNEMDLTL